MDRTKAIFSVILLVTVLIIAGLALSAKLEHDGHLLQGPPVTREVTREVVHEIPGEAQVVLVTVPVPVVETRVVEVVGSQEPVSEEEALTWCADAVQNVEHVEITRVVEVTSTPVPGEVMVPISQCPYVPIKDMSTEPTVEATPEASLGRRFLGIFLIAAVAALLLVFGYGVFGNPSGHWF